VSQYFQQLQERVVKEESVFIARNATVLGNVTLGKKVSVWYNAVIRGDSDRIIIGDCTNIQDHCVVHVDKDVPVIIGRNVIVGHRAIIHGCKIGNNCLIGMGSIIMNHCIVGDYCIIGANTLLPENTVIPDNSLVIGSPGKVVKTVTQAMMDRIQQGVDHYCQEAARYL